SLHLVEGAMERIWWVTSHETDEVTLLDRHTIRNAWWAGDGGALVYYTVQGRADGNSRIGVYRASAPNFVPVEVYSWVTVPQRRWNFTMHPSDDLLSIYSNGFNPVVRVIDTVSGEVLRETMFDSMTHVEWGLRRDQARCNGVRLCNNQ
ncbi:MAG: hypothetical protein AAF125_18165, partial [Chloroflexota bacterium]